MLALLFLFFASAPDQAHRPTAIELQQQAARQQRNAIRDQLGVKVDEQGSGEFEFLTPPTLKPEVDCAPLDSSTVDSLIATAAKKQSLPVGLLRAVMHQESGFKPCAVSTRGAQGLMQIMPDTAAELHVSDPFDPQQNVEAGAAYLKQMMKKYNGDLKLALVAYNAGPLRADQLDPSKYPAETQAYVAAILAEVGPTDKPKEDKPADPVRVP